MMGELLNRGLPMTHAHGDTTPPISRHAPFPHMFAPALLAPDTCQSVIDKLETTSKWEELADSHHNEPPGAKLAGRLPASLALLESAAILATLKGWLSQEYGVEFEDRHDLNAGRFSEGHQLYPHNDAVTDGCSHRAVMFLTRNWSWADGGCLWLLASPRQPVNSPGNMCYPPIPGNVVLFPISQRSFHAVSLMKKGVRYSLTYSFYARQL
jgi:Rps23 Pro-64 3,4-dihydroxylase Tpa1-like proline 4-hydroxylase